MWAEILTIGNIQSQKRLAARVRDARERKAPPGRVVLTGKIGVVTFKQHNIPLAGAEAAIVKREQCGAVHLRVSLLKIAQCV